MLATHAPHRRRERAHADLIDDLLLLAARRGRPSPPSRRHRRHPARRRSRRQREPSDERIELRDTGSVELLGDEFRLRQVVANMIQTR